MSELPLPLLVAAVGAHHRHLLRLLAAIVVAAIVLGLIGWAVVTIRRTRRGPSGAGRPGPVADETGAAAVAAEQLTKSYKMGKVVVHALEDVSLEIPDGAMVCIMGRSGSGKSTLLRQLGLIDLPSRGRVYLHGREVTGLSETSRGDLRLRTLGYVFQEYALLPELTAEENVYLPAMMAGRPARQYRRRASELLDLVGLAGRASHRPKELSGGEQQRVAIARALVNEPRVVYADEPTANLDTRSARTVMQTLQKLNEELGVTVVFVSHDPADAQYAGQLVHLADGRIIPEQISDGHIADEPVGRDRP